MHELLALPLVLKVALGVLGIFFLIGIVKRMIKLAIILAIIILAITVIYPMFNY